MVKGFPVDGTSINERAKSGTRVLNEVTAFSGLKTERETLI
jgi:hypothetical protein